MNLIKEKTKEYWSIITTYPAKYLNPPQLPVGEKYSVLFETKYLQILKFKGDPSPLIWYE